MRQIGALVICLIAGLPSACLAADGMPPHLSVASLPDRTTILYSAIDPDGVGTYDPPADALSSIETLHGRGDIGGSVLWPRLIGEDAGRLPLRVRNGEPSLPSSHDVDRVKPLFDWRQLQKWNVAISRSPAGSEVRFQILAIWEQYRWHSLAALVIILVQALLIAGLLYERRGRIAAEIQARQRMSELARLNRQATAGEMTAALAHELNQPLAAILSNAEAAESILKTQSPDINEVREILADIRRDVERAGEVIRHLRALLKKSETETFDVNINATLRDVFRFLSVQAVIRDVRLETDLSASAPQVRGDRIQLEQVILNLVTNAMDAVAGQPKERRRVIGQTALAEGNSALVSVVDFGHGIPAQEPARVFDPLFTTKEQGMGIGLSIARTIVEAHGGRIWAENRPGGGAAFHASLPLAPVKQELINDGGRARCR